MTEQRTPQTDSGEPILTPQDSRSEVLQEPSVLGWRLAAILFVVVAGIAVGYGWLEHDAAQQLATEREDLRTSLAQAKSQDDALTAKVNALTTAQAQEEAARTEAETAKVEQFPPRNAEASVRRTHPVVASRRAPADDPRWAQFQQQLGEQQKLLGENQKDLAENKELIAQTQANLDQAKSDMGANLQSARTELGGDIARNHEELAALQKKGERNYFEFSFEKSKTPHHTGPVSIALRRADPKHQYCDLDVVVDDSTIAWKHVNLFQSVSLYPEGYSLPVEVVINHIDKDAIRGYVSAPKYPSAERAVAAAPAAANAPSASGSPSEPAPPSEVKLEHRDPAGIVH